jgi:hypothetical protein
MKILKVIVDNLPPNCHSCNFCCSWFCILLRKMVPMRLPEFAHFDSCPLELEKNSVCKYTVIKNLGIVETSCGREVSIRRKIPLKCPYCSRKVKKA